MSIDPYYRTKIIQPGTSVYYSLRMLPKPQREALTVLYTLLYEIASIVDHVKDPSIGQIKLAWWKSELEKAYQNTPTHPLTKAMSETLIYHPLPLSLLTEYIDGLSLKLTGIYCETEKDFELYAYRNQGIPFVLSSWITCPQAPAVITFANEMGISLEIIRQIINLRHNTLQNSIYFSQQALSEYQLHYQDFFPRIMTEKIKEFLTQQHMKARIRCHHAIKNLPKNFVDSQRHLMTLAKIKLSTLDEISKSGYPVFTSKIHLTALRKLWLSWRNRPLSLKPL